MTEHLWNGYVKATTSQQEEKAQYSHIEKQHQRENKALPTRHSPQSAVAGIAGCTLCRFAEIVIGIFGKRFQISVRHTVGLVMLQ